MKDCKSKIIGILLFSIFSLAIVSAQKTTAAKKLTLFKQELKNTTNPQLCSFVEKYLYELSTLKTEEAVQRMQMDKFTIEYGYPTFIPNLSDSMNIRITYDQNKRCHITWSDKELKVFSISFPNQYELILGLNKIDIENQLEEKLLNHSFSQATQTFPAKELYPTDNENIFITSPGYYQIENMSSEQYYIKKKDSFLLIKEWSYPLETLSNIMTTTGIASQIQINITQNKYNNKKSHMQVPLNQWISFCLMEGCTPYIGIEQLDKDNIRATVIMDNKWLGYVHLLFFSFPRQILHKMNGTLDATLYAYIPGHNMKNLFDDYNIKLKKSPNQYHIRNIQK